MPDPTGYYKWLSTELRRVHGAVKVSREEVKKEDKVKYYRAHKAIEPTWKVGNSVLLQESTVKPGSSKVITKQRFVGPYIIQDIVVGRPDVGQAYRLVDETSGSAMAEGPRDAHVSRNSAITKHPTRQATCAF